MPPGGEGERGQGARDDKEMGNNDGEDKDDEEESKESGEEDPVNGQTGKEYNRKTKKGKEMAKTPISFCHLSKSSANTTVVYFGMSMMEKLADFHEDNWKDAFVQWQKHHTCPSGSEQELVLAIPHDILSQKGKL